MYGCSWIMDEDKSIGAKLVAECAMLDAKIVGCSATVRELRRALGKAKAEENSCKSALRVAQKRLKQFEIEQKIGPSVIAAKAAIAQWSDSKTKEDRAAAAKRYYEAIPSILNVDLHSLPILPVKEHEDITMLIRVVFSSSLRSVEISRKSFNQFDEKRTEEYLCITIIENDHSMDKIMLRKIIASLGLFDDVVYDSSVFSAIEKGSKYAQLPNGVWIDKTIFDPDWEVRKCAKCDKWIPRCNSCKRWDRYMYTDKHVAICTDFDCKLSLGYVEYTSSDEDKPEYLGACECRR
ncbi:MAG: hypothetical protein Hyperionvirus25_7 [Hyperionvirus sp.]|uniref:Uncharacterized protein n=1 Tax=Hyperionvirus sp. TaxID=2487770 RepID=A0A3G5ADS4_9VIRU|nr:MAG: hypothetical protein Hyperionvirus25_7 [Hyperionvirus sp.]